MSRVPRRVQRGGAAVRRVAARPLVAATALAALLAALPGRAAASRRLDPAGAAALASAPGAAGSAGAAEPSEPAWTAALQADEALLRAKAARGPVRVVVEVRTPARARVGAGGRRVPWDRVTMMRELPSAREVLAKVRGTLQKPIGLREFRFVPHFAVTVESSDLDRLLRQRVEGEDVLAVREDVELRPAARIPAGPKAGSAPSAAPAPTAAAGLPGGLPVGLPGALVLSGADQLPEGLDGRGSTVVVIDTGIDAEHPFLSGRVGSGSFYTSAQPGRCGDEMKTSCTGAWGSTEAGLPAQAGPSHGTNVAAVIAGHSSRQHGIAPGVNLHSIRVAYVDGGELKIYSSDLVPAFEEVYARVAPESTPVLSPADQVLTIETLAVQEGMPPIVAVNVSLSSDELFSGDEPCDCQHGAVSDIVELLREHGIAVVVASGNDGKPDELPFPACLQNVVAVASSGRAGGFASSNVTPLVRLAACGENMSLETSPTALSGTSLAAPLVAGAWALLAQAYPDSLWEDRLAALESAPPESTVKGLLSGTERELPRLDVAHALELLADGLQGPAASPAPPACPEGN